MEFIEDYRGDNQHEIVVTDSDKNNPIADELLKFNVKYTLNQGQGFDDNLYYFYINSVNSYDYILSISDDDLFFPQRMNPFHIIDAALLLNAEAVMFNHRPYFAKDGDIDIIPSPWSLNPLLGHDNAALQKEVFHFLPRHICLLYSTEFLTKNKSIIAEFRDTLHLYSVPFLLAVMNGTAVFVDYCLCLFFEDVRKDGAWSDTSHVFYGLMRFLKLVKQYFPDYLYQISYEGFMELYFGKESFLRSMSVDHPLPSLHEIDAFLEDDSSNATSE
jgi:hypothetical protein